MIHLFIFKKYVIKLNILLWRNVKYYFKYFIITDGSIIQSRSSSIPIIGERTAARKLDQGA